MARFSCALVVAFALTSAIAHAQSLGSIDAVNAALGVTDSEVQPVFWRTDGDALFATVAFEGHDMIIRLAPHSVRADDFRVLAQGADGSLVEVDPGPVRTYRGGVVGDRDVLVAAGLQEDGVHARLHYAHGADVWMQPLASLFPSADPMWYVIYHGDAVIADASRHCDALETGITFTSPGNLPAGSGLSVAQLGCDADFEFFSDYGSVAATQNRIQTVINSMNVQYETQVDITHEITTILVRSSSNQPYTSTNASTLLNQFRSQWLNNHGSIPRDVAHLFTGKNLNGSTIGIAWIGAVCSTFGFGLVESNFVNNFACSTDLSAHELGHNWGANHCSCSGFTMNPSITCANSFHPTITQPAIVSFRNSVGCLETDPGGGPGTTVVYSINFNAGAAGWNKSSGGTDLWRLGADCVGTSSTLLAFSRPSPNCDYDVGTATGWARSPNVNLSGASSATLTFRHFWQTESFSGAFDRMMIQVSANGGSTWSTVKEINSSNANSGGFVTENLNVSAFISGTFRFRFLFDSVDGVSNDFLGWYVDDIVVTIN